MPKIKKPKTFIKDTGAYPKYYVGVKKGSRKIVFKSANSLARAKAIQKRMKKTGLVS